MYFAAGQTPPNPVLPTLPGCPPYWEGRWGVGEPLSGFWHGLGHLRGMDGWVGAEDCRGPSAGPGCKASRDSLGCWGAHHPGVPITLASGHADKGCLQSPELAPSECCPQPPTSPPHAPWVQQAPAAELQQGQDARCKAHGVHATSLEQCSWSPIHGLGVGRLPSAAPGASSSPGRLRSSRLGTISCGTRTTLLHRDQGTP